MIEKKKRKGTRAKGRAFEKRCADILEEYGFHTYTAPPKLGWWKDKDTGELKTQSKSQDIFGCIDIIAKSPEVAATFWIQCGERTTMAKKKRDVQEFPAWTRYDRPMVFIKNPDRTISVFLMDLDLWELTPRWEESGKFDNRRNWIPTPAQANFSWGTRTPKTRKVKND